MARVVGWTAVCAATWMLPEWVRRPGLGLAAADEFKGDTAAVDFGRQVAPVLAAERTPDGDCLGGLGGSAGGDGALASFAKDDPSGAGGCCVEGHALRVGEYMAKVQVESWRSLFSGGLGALWMRDF